MAMPKSTVLQKQHFSSKLLNLKFLIHTFYAYIDKYVVSLRQTEKDCYETYIARDRKY